MLRRDTSAHFRRVRHKHGFFRRWESYTYVFESSTLFKNVDIDLWSSINKQSHKTEEEFKSILLKQQDTPVMIVEGANQRRWWMFKDKFYWEDEGYSALEVKALLLKRERDKERRLKRAKALMEQEEAILAARREQIPDEVKIFVWRRDGGRCVKCGSKENLEFDHIIPISKGGSNTARNIQLLCEKCNREKGNSIV